MRRGEVWWADFDERRAVVLLSGGEASGFLAMQVVAPAGTGLSGVAVEVTVGAPEGLPLEGVLRVALPRPGLIPCTWLVTLTREDLIGQVGVLPSAKLGEIEDALRLGGLE
ncbi:type II toxin-antitoxin system PemK/MazF family toxin [Streptomyces tendae]|uniref:type II toxin-antitoxin system PemK/MazF family toxin n=1 Tax=Streptomyces tendae TaxID=1932 RepID=UPI0036891724